MTQSDQSHTLVRSGSDRTIRWRIMLLSLILLGLGSVALLVFSPKAAPVEGSTWGGSIELLPEQALTAWPQFGRDAAHTGNFTGANPLQGQVGWRLKTGGPLISSAVTDSDTVYIASSDGYLYAIESHRGKVLWQYSLGPKLVNSTPALAGGLLLVAGDYSWLNAIDAHTGQRVWRYDTGNDILAPPAVDPGAGLAFVTNGNSLFALNLRDGQPRWEIQISDSTVHSWPSVAAPTIDQGVVYWAPGVGAHVFALDEATSRTRWTFDAHDRLASTPTVSAGRVYVATWTGHLFSINAASGELRWQRSLGHSQNGEGTESAPAIEGNQLFIGSYQGMLYAFDADSGQDLWQFQTRAQILPMPAVNEGVVYCSSGDGQLYAIEAASGKLKWTLTLGEMRGSPALNSNGLFIGTMTSSVFQIK